MKTYFLLFFSIIFLGACQSDPDIKPFEPTRRDFMITEQTDNQKLVMKATYNPNYWLAEKTTYDSDIIRSVMLYDDEQKRLIRQNDFFPDGSSAGYRLYFYDFYGRLEKIEHYKPDLFDYRQITLHHYEIYEYNMSHQLIKFSYYHRHGSDQAFTIDNYQEFDYNSVGNVIAHRIYGHRLGGQGDMVLAVTGSFEYDKNTNPFPINGLRGIDIQSITQNNITKATYVYPNNRVYDEGSYQAEYEYTTQGIPQKATIVYANGTILNRQWTYQWIGK